MAAPTFIKKYWPALASLSVFFLLGIALGVGLTATGIFAPFGVTVLGLVAAGAILLGGSLAVGILVSAAIAAFRNANPPLENYQLEDADGDMEPEKGAAKTPKGSPSSSNTTEKTEKASTSASELPTSPRSTAVPPSPAPAPTITPQPELFSPVLPTVTSTPPPPIATQEDAEKVKKYILVHCHVNYCHVTTHLRLIFEGFVTRKMLELALLVLRFFSLQILQI